MAALCRGGKVPGILGSGENVQGGVRGRKLRGGGELFGGTGLEYGEDAVLVVSLFWCGVGDACLVAGLFDG